MIKLRFYNNGNVIAFNRHEQMSEIQSQSWLLLYVEWLQAQGYNMDDIELMSPDGRFIKLFTNNDGKVINWQLE